MTSTIPGIREQVARWSGRSAKEALPKRETLNARDLTILGVVGRSTYATHGGRELRLKGPAMPHAIEQAPANATFVEKLVRAADGRTMTDIYLASEVEAGTFARMAARKRYVPRERLPGAIDRDDELRGGELRQWVTLGKDADTPEDVVRGALSSKPGALVTDGRPRLRNVADEIAMIQRAGVTLALSDDGSYLLATSSKALTATVRAMLDNRDELYRAYLSGSPLRCAWPHPEGNPPDAVTVAVGNAPCCGQHLTGTPA